MKRLGLTIVLASLCVACSESHDDGGDAEILFDAAVLPDGGPSDPGAVCGNGDLEPGERCDDGNTAAGDGCDAACAREGYCGDGTVAAGETCDDGNNASGDGCRSDCSSDESCGNGIVDYAAGEVCDGTPGCDTTTCQTVSGCGDGTIAAPETCDDSNMSSFDGCDAACREEIALVIDTLALAGRGSGCDLNGDGTVDNAFQRALGLLGAGLGAIINQAIESGDLTLLMSFLGLDDPLAVDDDDFRIAWLQGTQTATEGEFTVDPSSLTDGAPTTSIQSSVSASMLTGGPEDIPLPLPIPLQLEQAHIQGRTIADMGELYRIGNPDTDDRGLLCGGIPANLIALLSAFLGDMLETSPPCDGGDPAGLLDVIIGGGSATVNFGGTAIPVDFTATAPDLDLDGDGLEAFEVLRDGPDDCQAVVVACTDGDGTRIDGRGCYQDPAIGDGYSAAFEFTAVQATLVPAAAPPPEPEPAP